MRIKIERTEKSINAIQAVMDVANGRGRERTLNAEDIASLAEHCEAKLDSANIPKKYRKGTVATTDGGYITAKSYKYKFQTTSARIERGADAWFLTNCGRDESYPGGNTDDLMILTSEGAEWYKRESLSKFQVI